MLLNTLKVWISELLELRFVDWKEQKSMEKQQNWLLSLTPHGQNIDWDAAEKLTVWIFGSRWFT